MGPFLKSPAKRIDDYCVMRGQTVELHPSSWGNSSPAMGVVYAPFLAEAFVRGAGGGGGGALTDFYSRDGEGGRAGDSSESSGADVFGNEPQWFKTGDYKAAGSSAGGLNDHSTASVRKGDDGEASYLGGIVASGGEGGEGATPSSNHSRTPGTVNDNPGGAGSDAWGQGGFGSDQNTSSDGGTGRAGAIWITILD